MSPDSNQEVIPARSPKGYHELEKDLVTSSTDKNRERDMEEVLLLAHEDEEQERIQKEFLREVISKFHNKINGHLGINKTMQCVEAYMQDHPTDVKTKMKSS